MISIIISYLVAFGVGGIIGIIVKHFLDRSREKKLNTFEMKREAYTKAIVEISGLADKTFLFALKNNDKGDVSAIAITDYMADIQSKTSGARLVATKNINNSLGKITSIIIDGTGIISKTLKSTKKVGDKYVISLEQPAAQELVKWKKQTNIWESNIISAMQKELGIDS